MLVEIKIDKPFTEAKRERLRKTLKKRRIKTGASLRTSAEIIADEGYPITDVTLMRWEKGAVHMEDYQFQIWDAAISLVEEAAAKSAEGTLKQKPGRVPQEKAS